MEGGGCLLVQVTHDRVVRERGEPKDTFLRGARRRRDQNNKDSGPFEVEKFRELTLFLYIVWKLTTLYSLAATHRLRAIATCKPEGFISCPSRCSPTTPGAPNGSPSRHPC